MNKETKILSEYYNLLCNQIRGIKVKIEKAI